MPAEDYLEVGDEVRYVGKDTKLFKGAYGIVVKIEISYKVDLDNIIVKWSNGFVYGVLSNNLKVLHKHKKMYGYAFHEVIRMFEKGLLVENTELYCENEPNLDKVLRFKVVKKDSDLILVDCVTEQEATMKSSDFIGKWSFEVKKEKSFLKLTFVENPKYIGLNKKTSNPTVLDSNFDTEYQTQFTDSEIDNLTNDLNKLGYSLKSFEKVSLLAETIYLRQESSLNLFA